MVQRIDPDRAVAKLDDKTKQGTIKVGDGVATKLNSKTSPPGDSVPPTRARDAGRLGAALASSADIAAAEAELSEAERHYDHTEAMVKKGFQKQSDLEVARRAAESAQAKLRNAQREYEAKRRLLQLDVESANVNVNAAAAALETAAETYRLRAGPPPSMQHFALQQAELELKRAETLLALHIGNMGESQHIEEAAELEAPEQNAGVNEAEAEAAIWRSFGARVRAMSKVGMPGDRYNGGLIIRELRQDGPAAKAGLQQGDIIIGVRSWETLSPANLLFALTSEENVGDSASEGRNVKVLFLRQAQLYSTTVTLGSVPAPPRQGGEGASGERASSVSPAAPQVTDLKGEKSPIDKSSLDKVSKHFRHETRVANGLVTSGGVIESIEDDTIRLTSGDSIEVGKKARIMPEKTKQKSLGTANASVSAGAMPK